MEKRRSFVVTLISVYEILFGVLILMHFIRMIVINAEYLGMGLMIGLFTVPFTMVVLVSGLLTYKLKPMGRLLNLILAYFMLVMGIWEYIQENIYKKSSQTYELLIAAPADFNAFLQGNVPLNEFLQKIMPPFLKKFGFHLREFNYFPDASPNVILACLFLIFVFHHPKVKKQFS